MRGPGSWVLRPASWFLAFASVASLFVLPAVASAQKLVIVVRHAERADGGSMSPNAQPDPLLSKEGVARAQRLASMLAESGIKAVYATEYHRTQDTAAPIAKKLGLQVQTTHKAVDVPGLVAELKAQHANDVVLLVGHSNSLPLVIKALGGPAITIAEEEYDAIYFLVPATGTLSKIRY